MEQKKGLSLVTSISIFTALLTLFVGDRLIERVVDGDEETRTKVLVGAVSAFAIVAVLSGFTYLYAVGPAGLLRVFITLLILVLVSAFFWDVATTFLGVYSIIRPGTNPAKALAGAANHISHHLHCAAGCWGNVRWSQAEILGRVVCAPPALRAGVRLLDLLSRDRVLLLERAGPSTLPQDQWGVLLAIAASVCLASIILGVLVPRLLGSGGAGSDPLDF